MSRKSQEVKCAWKCYWSISLCLSFSDVEGAFLKPFLGKTNIQECPLRKNKLLQSYMKENDVCKCFYPSYTQKRSCVDAAPDWMKCNTGNHVTKPERVTFACNLRSYLDPRVILFSKWHSLCASGQR